MALRYETPLSSRLELIDDGHVSDEVRNAVGVAPLVVVPRQELDEGVVKGNTCLGVEDARGGVTVEICGNNLVLGVVDYAAVLRVNLGGLDSVTDLGVGSRLGELHGEIDDGDVRGQYTSVTSSYSRIPRS